VRAVVATPEGASWTELREIEVPEPAANEALIAVRAFSINRGELRLLTARGEGWRPGQDVAGEVVQAAADESGPRAGERVAGLADWHGWAEYAVVPTHRLAVVPDGIDEATAAALPMAGTTAANLVRLGGSLLGKRVLVTGASGGVGHIAAQLAALAGADVTAVPAVPDSADARAEYDLILESAGGSSLAAAVQSVIHGGTIVCFGNSSGQEASIDFRAFAGKEARVESYFSARHEHQAGENLRLLLDELSAGRLHIDIGFHESWRRVNDALDGLAERRFAGKAVLLVD
jgi:NADPH2:quinone reductase